MLELVRSVGAPLVLALVCAAAPSLAQDGSAPAPLQQSRIPGQASAAPEQESLGSLLQQFDAKAPEAPGGVRLDAWVETTDAGKEVVVVVTPKGDTKLVADPGITVTPQPHPGVVWQLPLPHHMVDAGHDYFDPPAMVRLPFTSADDQPLQLLVEYAWCQIDYQCFLGEEELTVATVVP